MAFIEEWYQRLKSVITSRTSRKACCCGGKCEYIKAKRLMENREEPEQLHVNPYAPIKEEVLLYRLARRINIANHQQQQQDPQLQQPQRISKLDGIKRILHIGGSRNSDRPNAANDLQPPAASTLSFELPDISEMNVNRFRNEFMELRLLGRGVFGGVFHCVSRLDGCEYVIKHSKELKHSKFRLHRAMNELYANAALNMVHINLVRYYSGWIEDDCMNIQLEFCNGGDLAQAIACMRSFEDTFKEDEIEKMLYHVAEGLRWIHDLGLAHNNIKPENIFIKETYSHKCGKEVTYKIGSFGHVSSSENAKDLDEGDCRYLAKEIMLEDYSNLFKSDIFSLGLTIFEVAGGGPMPKNGAEWQDIRDGKIENLENYSENLNETIKTMIDPDVDKRPAALQLVNRRYTNLRRHIK